MERRNHSTNTCRDREERCRKSLDAAGSAVEMAGRLMEIGLLGAALGLGLGILADVFTDNN